MSLDNGVYIVEFKDLTFVVAGNAIESAMSNPNSAVALLETSMACTNYLDAFDHATKLEREIGPTEYGICYINDYANTTYLGLLCEVNASDEQVVDQQPHIDVSELGFF